MATDRVLCRGVSKQYGQSIVLDGIDLALAAGEAVAIVGRSGCGKSTLLRLIAGLDRPSAGSIDIDGKPLTGLNPHARVMFQDAALLPWKRVIDNVALGLLHAPAAQRQAEAAHALSAVGLGPRAADWPSVLSGGQRQRVSLARALACRPELLLLDEPLGALDALTRLDMQVLIESLWQSLGSALVLVTHDVDEAVTLANRILVMDRGRWTASFSVDLPRPRDRTAPEFTVLRNRVLDAVCHDPHRLAM
jgi:sulfonate transport system ATP-binding protein